MKTHRPLTFFLKALTWSLILFFLGMIYWSSLIQEEKLQLINAQVDLLEKEFKNFPQKTVETHGKNERVRPHIDPKYKNILELDPFFTETLPKLIGPNFQPKGTFRLATIGNPENLHPFSQWAQVSEWLGYCEGTLGTQKFGFYEQLAQDFAIKIEERDQNSFWVHLREDLFWQPLEISHFPKEMNLSSHFLEKHPVTSQDFKFFWDALSNSHVDVPSAVTLRFLLRDIEDIKVVDDLTFVISCKQKSYALPFYLAQLRPLARFVYQYNPDGSKICPDDSGIDFYRTSTTWAQSFANHFASRTIVSSGPWIFDGIDDKQIRFRKNPDFYSKVHALYEALEVYFLETSEALFRDFLAQKIDMCVINPQSLVELDRYLASDEYKKQKELGSEVKRLDFLARQFSYVGWNEKNPLFASKQIRAALTMAIDRARIIRQNLNGQAVEITGPFFYGSSENDLSIPPLSYDPDQAKRILAVEGWYDSVGDGLLHKEIDGKKRDFSFSLIYFVKDPIAKINCELIAQNLKEIGIECQLVGMDLADISNAFEDKRFDAVYLGWSLGTPPDDPRQLWHSEGANVKGSSNMIGFMNKDVDALIDAIEIEANPSKRNELFRKMHALLYEEQPYTFLYTTKATLLYWSWIENIFIPKDRQDLVPGAVVEQPAYMYSWRR